MRLIQSTPVMLLAGCVALAAVAANKMPAPTSNLPQAGQLPGIKQQSDAKLAALYPRPWVQLFVGTQPGCNAGAVFAGESVLKRNCALGSFKPIGYTFRDPTQSISAGNPERYVQIYSAIPPPPPGHDEDRTDTRPALGGVITSNPNHLGWHSTSAGFVQVGSCGGDTFLYVGTSRGCNAGVLTTNPNHLNCLTRPLGWTRPLVSTVPVGGCRVF